MTTVEADLVEPSVNPLYYVTFTTATLCASFILFSGFNTTDTVNTLSLISGFLVTFTGVYLLNLSRSDPHGHKLIAGRGGMDATGTDMVSSIQTRLSMQARRSTDPRLSLSSQHGDRQGLIRAYDEEEAAGFGLTDLAEDSDEENQNGRLNGSTANGHSKGYNDAIELQDRRSAEK
jgi:magnesium transporter